MILLLYVVLSCVPFVRASLPGPNDTSIHTLDSSTCSPCNTRTLWDILWSCGLTLFACSWTAVHPNIPGINDGVVRSFFYRLGLMVITLFIPEFTMTWAALQFVSARQAAKDFNDLIDAQCAHDRDRRAIWDSDLGDIPNSSRSSSTRWTLVHGFFASMGGFVLYVDSEPRATLIASELIRFVREGSVEMPVITEADIKDRSKGDVISKGVATLQLVWFIIQLIARYAQNLPVTLLEIDTLGVAALACAAYGFWLKKPKDIGRHHVVHWKSEVTAPPRRPYVANMWQYVINNTRRAENSMDDGLMDLALTAGSVSGMIFGAIHCLGWNYLFQAHKEQILWRVASAGMACSPLMITLMSLMDVQTFQRIQWLLLIGFMVSACAYIFSRVTIFVLMFLSLRSLPPGAYDTVDWTTFIPHVNL